MIESTNQKFQDRRHEEIDRNLEPLTILPVGHNSQVVPDSGTPMGVHLRNSWIPATNWMVRHDFVSLLRLHYIVVSQIDSGIYVYVRRSVNSDGHRLSLTPVFLIEGTRDGRELVIRLVSRDLVLELGVMTHFQYPYLPRVHSITDESYIIS